MLKHPGLAGESHRPAPSEGVGAVDPGAGKNGEPASIPGASFSRFWKLPSGALTVERGHGSTIVRVAPGGGGRASRPPVAPPSLAPVGIDAPELALVDGRVILNFDLCEVMKRFYLEEFRGSAATAAQAASFRRRLYYAARPAIPRRVQMAFRRRLARIQARARFPAWPIDTRLDDLLACVMAAAMAAAGRERLQMLGFWPRRRRYAVVLRHDIEGSSGVRNVDTLRKLEEAVGLRSVWNFVPERYAFNPCVLTDLRRSGHDIGVHGLYHDGKLFSSRTEFLRRAARINDYLESWGSRGFAAPSAVRKLDWIAEHLEVDFDSSVPTAEVFGAQPGGCSTVFPFLLPRSVVELPLTAQQDHTLFEILDHRDIDVWVENLRAVRDCGGLFLVTVHPDYMTSRKRLDLYRALLDRLSEDEDAWHALPGEVADWWRRRSRSELRVRGGSLQIVGPAQPDGEIGWLTLSADGLSISPS